MTPTGHRLHTQLMRLAQVGAVCRTHRYSHRSAHRELPSPNSSPTPTHAPTPLLLPTPATTLITAATTTTTAATFSSAAVNPDIPPPPPSSRHTTTTTHSHYNLPTTHAHQASMPKDSSVSQYSLVPKNLSWLLQHCPAFPVNGSKVRVITSPGEFYEELVTRTKNATQRITMSSLYLGTGHLEQQLVETMKERCEVCPGLRVHWLLDYTRGSRGQHNSRSMLQPLLHTFPDTCTVSLYHTPDLRGLLRWIIPQRWNEVIGLQHMKLYVFDDTLVISGANLSNDYFTNRQDRYMVIEDCPALANFYHRVVSTVSQFSLQLQPDDSATMPSNTDLHPYLGNYKKYCDAVSSAVQQLCRQECDKTAARLAQVVPNITASAHHHNAQDQQHPDVSCRETDSHLGQQTLRSQIKMTDRNSNPQADATLDRHTHNSLNTQTNDNSLDTIVFPTLQMGPFGISNDSVVTNKFLSSAESRSRVQLASGYFNLTEEYMKCILNTSKASYNILMAHPKANGFLGARGFAGAIPAAYTQLAKGFLSRVLGGNQGNRLGLQEYQKPGWTFHAKGLWYYPPLDSLPTLTMIGSPNFGWRSVNRDLESQVVVLTQSSALRDALHREQMGLYTGAEVVTQDTFLTQDRIVPLWVRCVMPIIKVFF
ncbi:hypothetical protein Pcinc_033515 [Petrolisthes cinctipes]|uniref:CDP-diacylglycerol--glycerol-3-phosphate 3-phosphatidyltransferase n=1 Tax=Petrolisthes cinctipes TaxID=88211 RepID=A0AAE1JX93_PETCI|nr:hypothetical protein Pcinc_033515 [Petrolisthes cinctipes]